MVIAIAIISCIVTWLTARHYYIKDNKGHAKKNKEMKEELKEMKSMLNKLPDDFLKKLKEDKRESLSVKELNKLLKEKTIDEELNDIFPYIACPTCGSEKLIRGFDYDVDTDIGDDGELMAQGIPYKLIYCKNCEWQKTELEL